MVPAAAAEHRYFFFYIIKVIIHLLKFFNCINVTHSHFRTNCQISYRSVQITKRQMQDVWFNFSIIYFFYTIELHNHYSILLYNNVLNELYFIIFIYIILHYIDIKFIHSKQTVHSKYCVLHVHYCVTETTVFLLARWNHKLCFSNVLTKKK